jgi:hypothetical protein
MIAVMLKLIDNQLMMLDDNYFRQICVFVPAILAQSKSN